MPRTASTQRQKRALHDRLRPMGKVSSEISKTPVLLRLPEVDTDVAEELDVEADEDSAEAMSIAVADLDRVEIGSSTEAVAQVSTNKTLETETKPEEAVDKAMADLPEGSWWEHWSSGVVLILLIIALVTASIIAFNDNADSDPNLLADTSNDVEAKTPDLDLDTIQIPGVDPSPDVVKPNIPATTVSVQQPASPQSNVGQSGEATDVPYPQVPQLQLGTPDIPSQQTPNLGTEVDSVIQQGAGALETSLQDASRNMQSAGESLNNTLQEAADNLRLEASDSSESLIPDLEPGGLQFTEEPSKEIENRVVAGASDVGDRIEQAAQVAKTLSFNATAVAEQAVESAVDGAIADPIRSSLRAPQEVSPPKLFEVADSSTQGIDLAKELDAKMKAQVASDSATTALVVPDIQLPSLDGLLPGGVSEIAGSVASSVPTANQLKDPKTGVATTQSPSYQQLLGMSGNVPATTASGTEQDAKFSTASHAETKVAQEASETAESVETDRSNTDSSESETAGRSGPVETSTPTMDADAIIRAYEFYKQLSNPSNNRYSPK